MLMLRAARTRGVGQAGRRIALRGQRRLASGDAPASSPGGMNPALTGALAGGGAALMIGYGWYHFSGAKSAVKTISQTQKYANQVTQKVKEKAPEPNQALRWLRETAQTYAGFIPGARSYVDKAFDDLDRIHEKHGSQVDEIIRKTYQEMRQIAQDKGASVEGVYEAWSALERCMREIGNLASDAAEDIMQNHPELREKVGGSFQTLQSMGETYGGDVREQVNQTFKEVRQIFSQGTTADAIQKARQVVEEKTNEIRKKSDDLWQKGIEQAKPYLEKSPKAKQLVEQNENTLKQGNISHLWAQVRNAADTGSTQQLEQFIQHTKDQVQSIGRGSGGGGGGGGSSGNLASSLAGLFGGGAGGSSGGGSSAPPQSVAGGSDLASSVQTLSEIVQKHGSEAEGLLKSTVDEIKDVLQKKAQEAEQIANKARSEKS